MKGKPRLALLALMAVACLGAAERWRVQYMYDEQDSTLAIVDLKFPSATRGVAVGELTGRGMAAPVALVTGDGGKTWDLIKLKEGGQALFFLNENIGWMVTAKGLWKTVESGRTWTKLRQGASARGITQIYFRDENNGWAIGQAKGFYSTADGGAHWTRVPVVDQVDATRERTVFTCIAFGYAQSGMVVGVSTPQRRREPPFPVWMDPEAAFRRAELPHLVIFIQTTDGGKTWDPSVLSMFGNPKKLSFGPDGRGLLLLQFLDSFTYPSEVLRLERAAGKSGRAFRREDRAVTDVAVPAGGPAYLASVEPPGKLPWSPVPGRVKLLKSTDMSNWTEMEVDYRAVARQVILAEAGADHVWAATDTGMILRLESK
jgi:hypothetical protein